MNFIKLIVKSKIFKDVFKCVYEDVDEVFIENEFIKLLFMEDIGCLMSMIDKSFKIIIVLS